MNANAPNTASCTTCCVCCKEIPLDAAFTPEGAEYVEHFCGWIAMNASRHAPRPRQNLTLRLSLAVSQPSD